MANAPETMEPSFYFISGDLSVNVAPRAAGGHWAGSACRSVRDTAALCVGVVGGVRSQTHRKSRQEGQLP